MRRRLLGESPRRFFQPRFAARLRRRVVIGRDRRRFAVPVLRRRRRQPLSAALRCPAVSPGQELRFRRLRRVGFLVTLRRRFGVRPARRRRVADAFFSALLRLLALVRRFAVDRVVVRLRLRQPFSAALRWPALSPGQALRLRLLRRVEVVFRLRFGVAVRLRLVVRVVDRRRAVRRLGEALRVMRVFRRAARAFLRFLIEAARCARV